MANQREPIFTIADVIARGQEKIPQYVDPSLRTMEPNVSLPPETLKDRGPIFSSSAAAEPGTKTPSMPREKKAKTEEPQGFDLGKIISGITKAGKDVGGGVVGGAVDVVSGIGKWAKENPEIAGLGLLAIGRAVAGEEAKRTGTAQPFLDYGQFVAGGLEEGQRRKEKAREQDIDAKKAEAALWAAGKKGEPKPGAIEPITMQQIDVIQKELSSPDFITPAKQDAVMRSYGVDPKAYPSRQEALRAMYQVRGLGEAFDTLLPSQGTASRPTMIPSAEAAGKYPPDWSAEKIRKYEEWKKSQKK